jgi:hypothetical protein
MADNRRKKETRYLEHSKERRSRMLQMVPVQFELQVHVFGFEHTPLTHDGEQMATDTRETLEMVPLTLSWRNQLNIMQWAL